MGTLRSLYIDRMRTLSRNAPCPTDPALRDACLKTRKVSLVVYAVSVAFYLIGGWFAFFQPWLQVGTLYARF